MSQELSLVAVDGIDRFRWHNPLSQAVRPLRFDCESCITLLFFIPAGMKKKRKIFLVKKRKIFEISAEGGKNWGFGRQMYAGF